MEESRHRSFATAAALCTARSSAEERRHQDNQRPERGDGLQSRAGVHAAASAHCWKCFREEERKHIRNSYSRNTHTHIVSSAAHTVNLYQSITSGSDISSTFLYLLPHVPAQTHTHTPLSLVPGTWSRWQSADVSKGECVTWLDRHQHRLISVLRFVMWSWDERYLYSCRWETGQKNTQSQGGCYPQASALNRFMGGSCCLLVRGCFFAWESRSL